MIQMTSLKCIALNKAWWHSRHLSEGLVFLNLLHPFLCSLSYDDTLIHGSISEVRCTVNRADFMEGHCLRQEWIARRLRIRKTTQLSNDDTQDEPEVHCANTAWCHSRHLSEVHRLFAVFCHSVCIVHPVMIQMTSLKCIALKIMMTFEAFVWGWSFDCCVLSLVRIVHPVMIQMTSLKCIALKRMMTFEAFVWGWSFVCCVLSFGLHCTSSDDTDDEPEVHCTKQSMMTFEAFVWGSCLFELAAPVPLFFVLWWHTHSRFNFWSALHCKPCWFHGRPLSEAGMDCQKIAYKEDNTAIQWRYTRRAWSALR